MNTSAQREPAAAPAAGDRGTLIIVAAIVFIVVAIGVPAWVDWVRKPDAAQLALAEGAAARAAERFGAWQVDAAEADGAPLARAWRGSTSTLLFVEAPRSAEQFVARDSAARVWARSPDGQVFTVDYYYDGVGRPLRASALPTLQSIGRFVEAAVQRNDLRALQTAGLRLGAD